MTSARRQNMALSVNTNNGALNALSAASLANKALETSMLRLSTGKRINSAADDAAGMGIADRMTSQIKGVNQAIRNAQDGQSMIDTAEGAHSEITAILQRMRELAVQASNDTNTTDDRINLQSEVTSLIAEIDRISDQTTWNGFSLMDGTSSAIQLQLGADADQTSEFSIDSTSSGDIGAYTANVSTAGSGPFSTLALAQAGLVTDTLTITGTNGTNSAQTILAGASAYDIAELVNNTTDDTGVAATAKTIVKIDTLSAAGTISMNINGVATGDVVISDEDDLRDLRDAINTISSESGVTATVGDDNTELLLTDRNGDNIEIDTFVHSGTTKTIIATVIDEDSVDAESATLTSAAGDSAVLRGYVTLSDDASFSMNFGTGASDSFTDATADLSSINVVDVSTASGANSALTAIDGAINAIGTQRGELGAVSNRLDHTISNLTNVSTNTEISRGRIEDADFAAESTGLARAQILSQAATAMLAQANAAKQGVLQLLQR
jgi:flagellin